MVLVTHTNSSSLEMDDWTVCWDINIHFHERCDCLDCYICGKRQASSNYRSNFLRDATSCRKGHTWRDWAKNTSCICNICDIDNVLTVTKREKKCFVEGCESLLNVAVKVVEDKIDDESVLGK